LREEDRGIVGLGTVDRPPGAVAYEKGVEPHVVLKFLIGIRGHAQGDDIDDLRIQERLWLLLDKIKERAYQILRLTAAGADENPIPGTDLPEDEPLLISKLARPSLLYLLPADCAPASG